MKPRCTHGFTILEWLTSFFITLLVLTIVFQFSAKIYAQLIEKSVYNTMFTDVTVALDAMSKHISQAPAETYAWKHGSGTQLQWADPKSNIILGYLYEKQNLFFIKGKRRNVIARNLQDVTFVTEGGKETVTSVRCSVSFVCHKKKHTIHRIIMVKNREVS